jgi:exopolysaccharide biosynthesis polyprenyl glycosylphosphotransferase
MIHESAVYAKPDQRRHRRHTFASRTYLALMVAAAEGALACFLLAVGWPLIDTDPGSWSVEELIVVAVLGAIYAWLAVAPAQRLLTHPGGWHLDAGQILFSWLAIASTAYFAGPSRSLLVWMPQAWLFWGFGAAILLVWRLFAYRYIAMMFDAGRFQLERVGLVGSEDNVRRFQKEARIWRQGCQVVAIHIQGETETQPGGFSEFAKLCVTQRCDHVLVVGELSAIDNAHPVLDACQQYALNVVFAPLSRSGALAHKLVDVMPLGPANSVRMLGRPLDDKGRAAKRTFDILAASLILLTIFPVLLLTALAIRLTSPGPALYRQERRGFNGQPFFIYKFRSMNVTEDGRAMRPAVPGDTRITPIGQLLRRTNIDELPQLLNVLTGEMSLVGPRPHALSHDDDLSRRYAAYAQRRRIKPGITGWAQVNGFRGDVSTAEAIEGRTRCDLHYIEHWSVELDIWILVLTLFSRRAYRNAG